MNLLSRTFGATQPAYLIRSYVIGFVFSALMIWMMLQSPNGDGIKGAPALYFLLCTLCFPFVKLVWDELRNLLLGDNFFLMNALFLMVLKLFVNIFLWGFAIFIAPSGLLYPWFRTRTPHQEME